MKWSLPELRKLIHIDNEFHYVADFQACMDGSILDLVDISPVNVSGSFQVMEEEDQFIFLIEVECTLTMLCAITLDEVAVPMRFESELVFGHDPEDDNMHLIEGNTIDLDPFVFAEILIEKPMKVVSEHAYDGYKEEIVTLDDEEKTESNPFAKLKK